MSSNNSMRTTRSAAKKMKLQHQMLGFADIPEDTLFYNILPRLPIKQIFKFRSVCKRWYALTNEFLFIINQAYHSIHSSSNQFVYLQKNRGNSLSVISFEEQSRYRLPPPYAYHSSATRVMYAGTCAGLVYGYASCDACIFVCNPITQRIVFVKRWQCLGVFCNLRMLALAFDPPLTPDVGPELMRFKLICPFDNVHNVAFIVYCSAEKEWHQPNAYVQCSKPNTWGLGYTQSHVFVKGNVYWFDDEFMVWFNVNEEVAGTIPLPTNHSGITCTIMSGICSASVGACNGELSYCNITKDSKLIVWLRRNEWEKVREVSFDTIIKNNWDVLAPRTRKLRDWTVFYRRHIVYTMSYEGGDMLMFWVLSRGRVTRAFGVNSKTMELKELSAPDMNDSFSVYPYKATLLKNKNGDENDL
ncbi:hypothetical protein Syun_018126 [Stephania yunnanensis]|uniref:F-box domain-containing protein n=1 Tax=Stephania yunnanensis TaxID=152371 RepID=A0AAP0IRQ1_9MAGN